MQDVEAFDTFLKELPADAICVRAEAGARFVVAGEAGYTPFRTRPSASRRADIQRSTHPSGCLLWAGIGGELGQKNLARGARPSESTYLSCS